MSKVKAIPEGFSTITPSLILEHAKEAIELYKKAFGATEDYVLFMPDSEKVMHASLNIGSSKLFISDAFSNCGSTEGAQFYLYVEDADAAYKKALAAGLEANMPPEDMFWGDRLGAVKDKYGITWSLATHVRDVSPKEMEEGQKQFIARMAA